jgi:hypothetical protein
MKDMLPTYINRVLMNMMNKVSLRTSFSMKAPASKGSLLSAPYPDVLEQR